MTCNHCDRSRALANRAQGDLTSIAKRAAAAQQPPPTRLLTLLEGAKTVRDEARRRLADTQAECGCAA